MIYKLLDEDVMKVENVQHYNKQFGIEAEEMIYFQTFGVDYLSFIYVNNNDKNVDVNIFSLSYFNPIHPTKLLRLRPRSFSASSVVLSPTLLPYVYPSVSLRVIFSSLSLINYHFVKPQSSTSEHPPCSLNNFITEGDFIIPKILPFLAHSILLNDGTIFNLI
jgi:hypothetical protein